MMGPSRRNDMRDVPPEKAPLYDVTRLSRATPEGRAEALRVRLEAFNLLVADDRLGPGVDAFDAEVRYIVGAGGSVTFEAAHYPESGFVVLSGARVVYASHPHDGLAALVLFWAQSQDAEPCCAGGGATCDH
jgi:hypothetical protein